LTGELGSLTFTGAGSRALTDAFYYSRPAGTGAVTTGLADGDSYRTTGLAVREVSLSSLSSLEPGEATVPAPAMIPDGLDAFVSLAAKGKTSAGERLQAALTALTSEGYISHGGPDEVPSASGHGANRLAALFAATPMVGDAEQYSAAASLIATQLGFPSRVVMGFITPEGSDANTELRFTGSDMTAWIEISTAEGWVAVDPNPAERPIPEEQPQDPTEVAFPQTAVEPPAQEEPQLNDNSVPEAADEEQPNPVDPVLQAILAVVNAVGWTLLWLGLLVSPFLGVVVAKRRRRAARRSAADPRTQVEGAWAEVRDALIDHGTIAPDSFTRQELAATTSIPAATTIAVLADTAQYSTDPLSQAEVTRAWAEVDGVARELDVHLSRWQKIKARLSVKSFGLSWARFTAWLPKRR
jgi:transglutaminase-like putative cysteine protease